MNSKAGDKTYVFTKLLDSKLKVLSDSVSSEPERAKKPSQKSLFLLLESRFLEAEKRAKCA